jgi:hypothetical protein
MLDMMQDDLDVEHEPDPSNCVKQLDVETINHYVIRKHSSESDALRLDVSRSRTSLTTTVCAASRLPEEEWP